jgi:hypothetical protein
MRFNKDNVTNIKLRVASKGHVKLDICRCKNCRTVF